MKNVTEFLNAGHVAPGTASDPHGKPCPIKITDEFWMNQLGILFNQLREQEQALREQEKDIESLRRRSFRRARTSV